MRCEDLHPELSAWIDGELPAEDRARIAEHLQTCPACRDYVRDLQDTSSRVRTLPTPRAPAAMTQAAMSQVNIMQRQAVASRSRRRLAFGWPIPALGIGLAGVAAAIAVAVFFGRLEWKNPNQYRDSLQADPSSAATPLPNGAGYHLSSAPDSITGTIPITPGYDFRGGQNRRGIGTLNARERYAWDRGAWRHERRSGRDGWWWDVEGAGYWYDKPAGGPPAVVSDIRFAADAAAAGFRPQPSANDARPPQLR
jgi:hypothetical protein